MARNQTAPMKVVSQTLAARDGSNRSMVAVPSGTLPVTMNTMAAISSAQPEK